MPVQTKPCVRYHRYCSFSMWTTYRWLDSTAGQNHKLVLGLLGRSPETEVGRTDQRVWNQAVRRRAIGILPPWYKSLNTTNYYNAHRYVILHPELDFNLSQNVLHFIAGSNINCGVCIKWIVHHNQLTISLPFMPVRESRRQRKTRNITRASETAKEKVTWCRFRLWSRFCR